MLNEIQMRQKLREQAERFRHHYARKEWAKAKMAYFRAQTIAVFMELPDEEMIELFGNRAYKEDHEELKDGLFREEQVEIVSYECIKRNYTYDYLLLKPKRPDRYMEEFEGSGT